MTLDQEGSQMGGARSTGACQPIPVDDKYLVRDWFKSVETPYEIRVVEPTDAAAVTVHKPGTVQDKRPGAKANERQAQLSGSAKISVEPLVDPLCLVVDQPANHDDVVEPAQITDQFVRLNRYAAARIDGAQVGGDNAPLAADWPAPVSFVTGEAQNIDEVGEGTQCEAVQEQKPDRETG
jgi:hypothetical protein